jgi:very-short-patch-repair endonuclease
MTFLKNDPHIKERRRELRRRQTEAERFLWGALRNRHLQGLKFFRQYSFGPYILDFYCPEKSLAIELDGGQHNLPENRAYDADRTAYLEAHGVEVIRFWNSDVMQDVQAVLQVIAQQATESVTPPVLPLT